MTSVGDGVKPYLERHQGYQSWNVFPHEKEFSQVFPRESIIYLSPESPDVLTTVETDKVYIIGALVEHNAKKVVIMTVLKTD